DDSVVENHDDAAVRFCPNQPADALSQFQDRFRQRVFRKSVASAFLNELQLRFNQWCVRNRERQTGDDHVREGFTWNIDPAPKTVRAEEHASRGGFELVE